MTILKAMKIALGTLRAGSITSSLHWAITSYPWKAMKVSPIALKMDPIPIGRKGSKFPSHSGIPCMAQRPNPMNRRMTTTLDSVMMVPTNPASDAPL